MSEPTTANLEDAKPSSIYLSVTPETNTHIANSTFCVHALDINAGEKGLKIING